VQQAGVNLRTDPRNQFDLLSHMGGHTNAYNEEVLARLNAAYLKVAGQGQQAANQELGNVMQKIQQDVYNGTLQPYATKGVSKP
jgi:hypothetical protein